MVGAGEADICPREGIMSDEGKPGLIESLRKFTRDGWSNLVAGLNAITAKKKSTHHTPDTLLSEDELESIYTEDGLGARVINLMPEDMFREGWQYDFPELDDIAKKDLQEKYKAAMENIEAHQKCMEALQWARLKGGAAIFIGITDGMFLDQPLNPSKIKSFEKLKVLDTSSEIDLKKTIFQKDPTRPRFGLPEYYAVNFDVNDTLQETVMVHHTRIIEFHGVRLPAKTKRRLTPEQRYWGITVLQRAEEHLKIIGSSIASIDQLLYEISVGKYKIKNLANILSTPEGKELIQRRVEVQDMLRSVFRSQYIDAEEEFTRDNVSFASVPEILYIIFMLISADTGYPITRLFGVSPAGMNATGESDMRNYYDAVRSAQELILQPILLRLVRIISQWQNIEEPYIEFNPLETMNEKQKAELEKLKADTEKQKADTFRAYIDAGIMEPYEARFLEFGTTLDEIPVPEEELLPEVETVQEVLPEDESNSAPAKPAAPPAKEKK